MTPQTPELFTAPRVTLLARPAFAEPEHLPVDGDAGHLHASQDPDQGPLDVVVELIFFLCLQGGLERCP
ncbi:MAG: hypothetical protein B7Z72_01280, partial [Gemmatimonadetes bacterium 21-71-4]